MKNSSKRIKKCPFCPVSQVEAYIVENVEMKKIYAVGCGACGCRGPVEKSPDKAIKKWNVRPERKEYSCPLCNQKRDIESFQFKEGGTTYYQYKCECGFQSGFHRKKELIEKTWSSKS